MAGMLAPLHQAMLGGGNAGGNPALGQRAPVHAAPDYPALHDGVGRLPEAAPGLFSPLQCA